MDDFSTSIPPYLSKLLSLLEKPKSLGIAEKMVKCLSRKKMITVNVEENGTCLHSKLTQFGKPFVCQEFHWNCIIKYLTRETPVIANNEIIQSIKFFSLTKQVQNQFLTLLIKINKTIPRQCLEEFLSKVNSLHSHSENDWRGYLLRKLTVLSNSSGEYHCTPFTDQTINRLTSVICCTGSNSIRPFSSQETSGTNIGQANAERKRKRDEEDECNDDMNIDVKHFKIDESDHVASEEDTGPQLSHEIQSLIPAIRSAWNKGEKAMTEYFVTITSLTYREFQVCLSLLDIKETTESTLMAIAHNVIDPEVVDISFQIQTLIIQELIAPHLMSMQKLVSRVLLASLTRIITKFPMSSIDGWLYPFLLIPEFNAYQSDLLCKLIKQILSNEQRQYLWKKFVNTHVNIAGEPFIWNDHLIRVVQEMVQKGVVFTDESDISNFIHTVDTNASHHVTSLKFAQFLSTLLTRHTNELIGHVNILIDIVKSNSTILKNRLVTLTAKMSNI